MSIIKKCSSLKKYLFRITDFIHLKSIYFLIIKRDFKKKLYNESGQGTTEYAILVGVLVVIAILAIMIFRPKLEELWNAIAEGINGL